MSSGNSKTQDGYALILMLLALMGIGGIAIAGFTQGVKKQVEHEKFLHNKRVLTEAKQALLQFAYNYPVTSQRGPGRLPCPDADNNGQPNPNFAICTQLGRLPWNQADLGLYDIRDADGQRLWYAVSNSFATNVGGPANFINSDKQGSISIRDQVGNLIYDASVGEGVAAVIIAPGAATARAGAAQDRSFGGENPFDTTADTVQGIINSDRYLDVFFLEDNAGFNHNTTDGFILGRVDDLTSATVIVNDQIAVITTAELIEVAQRAVLQAYQDAINIYRDNIVTDTYPWLDDYATLDLTLYDADLLTRWGRVPSLFGRHFAINAQDTEAIRSALILDLDIGGFAFTQTVPATIFPVPVNPDILFRANGNLVSSFNSPYSYTRRFWDGHDVNVPSAPADGIWVECPPVNNDEDDCNQNGAGNYLPGTPISVDWMKVREVTVTFNNGLAPFEFPFADLMATPLNYVAPTAVGHATVTAEYNNNSAYMTVTWSQDDTFKDAFSESPAPNNGNFVFNVGVDRFTVGMTYYPELPYWSIAAQDNWHDSIQFAYSAGFQPGAAVLACGGANPPCLTVANIAGITTDKIAVLSLAADHNFTDLANDGYTDDLGLIFDLGNDDGDDVFDMRPVNGNDQILIIR